MLFSEIRYTESMQCSLLRQVKYCSLFLIWLINIDFIACKILYAVAANKAIFTRF